MYPLFIDKAIKVGTLYRRICDESEMLTSNCPDIAPRYNAEISLSRPANFYRHLRLR